MIGFGRFGQTVAQMLAAGGVTVTLIDSDVEQIDVAEEFGAKVYFGDGTRMDLLRQAGAAEASIIAFCIDGESVTGELITEVREAFPDARIFVRVFDRRGVIRLADAPADAVIRECMESAVKMGRAALDGLGFNLQDIDRAETAYRERDDARLNVQTQGGDVRAGKEKFAHNLGYH